MEEFLFRITKVYNSSDGDELHFELQNPKYTNYIKKYAKFRNVVNSEITGRTGVSFKNFDKVLYFNEKELVHFIYLDFIKYLEELISISEINPVQVYKYFPVLRKKKTIGQRNIDKVLDPKLKILNHLKKNGLYTSDLNDQTTFSFTIESKTIPGFRHLIVYFVETYKFNKFDNSFKRIR